MVCSESVDVGGNLRSSEVGILNVGVRQELFHYCTTETFFSIIKGHSVWLSDLSLSNDALEGRIVGKTIDLLYGEGIRKKGSKLRLSLIHI
jgi:hypothetical protein